MSKTIFMKYSNERARRFAIRTEIAEDMTRRLVWKKAIYPEGRSHVENMQRWAQELSCRYGNTKFQMNQCSLQEDRLLLEYLEGETLEQQLDNLLLQGKTEQVVEALLSYLEEVKKGFWLGGFQMTPEFEEVFGPAALPSDLSSGDIVDIDMVLNNVVLSDGWTLIDYEWTFEFPIPYRFVAWRILHYYLNGSSTREALHSYDLYRIAGITEEEQEIYQKMEQHFQEVYILSEKDGQSLHVPIRSLYGDISPGISDLTSLRFEEQNQRLKKRVQLYEAADLAFSEEESSFQEPMSNDSFCGTFSVKPQSAFVRLDPCSSYCVVRKLHMEWGEEIVHYQTNGIPLEDGSIFFPVEDPQIIVPKPQKGQEEFRAYFETEYLDMEEALYRLQKDYARVKRQGDELKNQLQLREEKIRQMENTKVWKFYRTIKKEK